MGTAPKASGHNLDEPFERSGPNVICGTPQMVRLPQRYRVSWEYPGNMYGKKKLPMLGMFQGIETEVLTYVRPM